MSFWYWDANWHVLVIHRLQRHHWRSCFNSWQVPTTSRTTLLTWGETLLSKPWNISLAMYSQSFTLHESCTCQHKTHPTMYQWRIQEREGGFPFLCRFARMRRRPRARARAQSKTFWTAEPPFIKNSRSATDYLTTPRTTTLLKATYPGGDWHPCHTIDQFSLFSRYAIFAFSSYIFTPLRSLSDRCFWWLTWVSRLLATSLKPSSTACSRPEDSAIAELTFLPVLSSPSVWNQV